MSNLLLILLTLFGALAIVVLVAQKHAKPMDDEQQSTFSRILVILVFVLLAARLVQYLLEG